MISVANCKLFPPPCTDGFPLEFGIGAWSQQKTRMMGLPDGQKSFKIGLAVQTKYRRVTDGHHTTARPRYAERRVGKNLTAFVHMSIIVTDYEHL